VRSVCRVLGVRQLLFHAVRVQWGDLLDRADCGHVVQHRDEAELLGGVEECAPSPEQSGADGECRDPQYEVLAGFVDERVVPAEDAVLTHGPLDFFELGLLECAGAGLELGVQPVELARGACGGWNVRAGHKDDRAVAQHYLV